MNWKPLLEEKDSKIYLDKLTEISECLKENAHKLKSNIGVMGGKTGVALFFFYYAQITMNEEHIDFAHDLLGEIFDEINNDFSLHTLAGGLAGVGWAMELLEQNDFIEADTDEMLEGLDPFLHKAMVFDIEKGNYDFLHGAVGNGTYFLNRLKRNESTEYLKELVDQLEKLHLDDVDGAMKWESTLDHEKGDRGYNLSLSHGMSSLVAFFAKLLEKDIYTEKVSQLLTGAVKYILSNRIDAKKHNSHFPSWVADTYPISGSRMAWCYGDLGMSVALWQAGQATDNNKWRDTALEVLMHTTGRKDLKENHVIDAGLCHGSAGMGHIYNRMFQYTGNQIFKETALYWLEQTMKMATYEDGYAGYKAWHSEKYGGWVSEAGLLEGISGIGLMLIAILTDIEPKWDRCLLLS